MSVWSYDESYNMEAEAYILHFKPKISAIKYFFRFGNKRFFIICMCNQSCIIHINNWLGRQSERKIINCNNKHKRTQNWALGNTNFYLKGIWQNTMSWNNLKLVDKIWIYKIQIFAPNTVKIMFSSNNVVRYWVKCFT